MLRASVVLPSRPFAKPSGTMRSSLRTLLFSLALLGAGCREQPPAPIKTSTPTNPNAKRVETEDSCVDGWLTSKHLDSFGNPPDTNYPGGNPLLDEITGEHTDRFTYLYKRFPELATLCRKAGR
jgi:hypothetical protein